MAGSNDPHTPPILRLPTELHNAIFAIVFEDGIYKLYGKPHWTDASPRGEPKPTVGGTDALLMCKSIHLSAIDTLYKMTALEFQLTSFHAKPSVCPNRQIELPARHKIQKVTAHVWNLGLWRIWYDGDFSSAASDILKQIPYAGRLSQMDLHVSVGHCRVGPDVMKLESAMQEVLGGTVIKTLLSSEGPSWCTRHRRGPDAIFRVSWPHVGIV
ncbi:hypothetical protein B0A48_09175 [Cryoendolithus antarcticus]|uniref:Uncharacterized protein n=1 Tax=Cryoendolithus antarcticus TaxID=1507870 RepID=A0A1V8T1X7_9PEZI|nr:hypothetical protein B0A48_09175 [Cryoendolithus antarcticus]